MPENHSSLTAPARLLEQPPRVASSFSFGFSPEDMAPTTSRWPRVPSTSSMISGVAGFLFLNTWRSSNTPTKKPLA
eukprot:2612802-Pyramimonas_sp.AAC.1